MEDQIFIQHRFTIEKDGVTLSDAIVLPQSEYETLTDKDIEAIKQERFDNFKQVLSAPPIETIKEEQLAEIEQQLATIAEQKEVLESQRVQLDEAIAVELSPISKAPIKGGK